MIFLIPWFALSRMNFYFLCMRDICIEAFELIHNWLLLFYIQADLLVLVNEKYRDWLKSQNNLQSCENDQDELKQREKIVAIFEKLVECCQTNISDREGEPPACNLSSLLSL